MACQVLSSLRSGRPHKPGSAVGPAVGGTQPTMIAEDAPEGDPIRHDGDDEISALRLRPKRESRPRDVAPLARRVVSGRGLMLAQTPSINRTILEHEPR